MIDTAPVFAEEKPSAKMVAAYGFLGLPLAFAGLPLYIHIPDFYTRDLGLGIATAGLILMLLRFLDAFQDPFIGYLSDKSASLQKAIIGTGIALLLLGMGALMFGPPAFIPVAFWFAGAVAITAMGLSMMSINLVMIGSLWSHNEATRSRISMMREGLSLVGMLLASVLPSVLVLMMDKPDALRVFYVIFAALLIAAFFTFSLFYKRLPKDHALITHDARHNSAPVPFRFFKQNSGFLSACFLTHLAASLPAILFLYFVSDYLGAANLAGLFLFLYFVSGAGLMGVWAKIAATVSAQRAWFFSMIVACVTFVWAFSLGSGDLIQFGIICVLSGAALGADLALPPVIMAQRLQVQSGESYASQAYAILNLMPKIALAIGTGTAFFLLDQAAFTPSAANTPEALGTLVMLYALAPCLIKAASGFIVFNLNPNNGETHDFQKRSFTDGDTHNA